MTTHSGKYLIPLVVYCLTLGMTLFSHVATFSLISFVPLLFVFILFSFFPLLLACRQRSLGQKKSTIYPLSDVLRSIPTGIKILVVLSILYTLVNTGIQFMLLPDGSLELVDGVPFLYDHAAGAYREITWETYTTLLKAQNRLFMGLPLMFAALPFGYYSGVQKLEWSKNETSFP